MELVGCRYGLGVFKYEFCEVEIIRLFLFKVVDIEVDFVYLVVDVLVCVGKYEEVIEVVDDFIYFWFYGCDMVEVFGVWMWLILLGVWWFRYLKIRVLLLV